MRPRELRLGDRVVSRIGYGALRLTGAGFAGPPEDPAAARALLRHAVDLGIDVIDTAASYGSGTNETLIAEALHPYPDRLVITSKAGFGTGARQFEINGDPDFLRAECEASLRRLRTDCIELYQLHAPDARVPLAESVGALVRLRDEGTIRHIGLSNVTVDELVEAERITPIASVQNRYSLTDRSSEQVLAACEARGIPFMPYFPLSAGQLTAPGGELDRIAREHDASPARVALAWLLDHSPSILAIPGTASIDHLEDNLAAADLELTAEECEALERAAGPVAFAARLTCQLCLTGFVLDELDSAERCPTCRGPLAQR